MYTGPLVHSDTTVRPPWLAWHGVHCTVLEFFRLHGPGVSFRPTRGMTFRCSRIKSSPQPTGVRRTDGPARSGAHPVHVWGDREEDRSGSGHPGSPANIGMIICDRMIIMESWTILWLDLQTDATMWPFQVFSSIKPAVRCRHVAQFFQIQRLWRTKRVCQYAARCTQRTLRASRTSEAAERTVGRLHGFRTVADRWQLGLIGLACS